MSDVPHRWRFLVIGGILFAALVGLGGKLSLLHLAPGEGVRENLITRRQVQLPIPAQRGNILDRQGGRNLLALDLNVKDVCADPLVVTSNGAVESVVQAMSTMLHLDADWVRDRVNRPNRRFEYLARFVRADEAESVRQAKLPGIFFRDAALRNYPHDGLLCHVLGFVNVEGMPGGGIELRFDRYLRGVDGRYRTEVDGRRHDRVIKREALAEPRPGADVLLTIDRNVQHMVERALDDAMVEHQARGAWAIVQQVATGDILAMVSRPGFDPNAYRTATPEQLLNRAIGEVYEPGSTLKVVAIAAALDDGLITPETILDCGRGSWMHAGRILRDFHPYDKLSLADVVKKSSNIGTAKVAVQLLGEKRLYAALRSFNLGAPLHLDLPGEEVGILHPVQRWSALDCSRISIGHGVSVTALQVLGIYGAIANGGALMRPGVVRRVVAPDGRVLYARSPEVLARPISSETAATMRDLLARVTEDGGTGRRARMSGIRVAGKTGTAEKPEAGGYSKEKHFASFVGFFPVEAPQVAMIVVVDEPQPLHTGGAVAAPVFGRIGEQVARYLGVPAGEPAVVASAR